MKRKRLGSDMMIMELNNRNLEDLGNDLFNECQHVINEVQDYIVHFKDPDRSSEKIEERINSIIGILEVIKDLLYIELKKADLTSVSKKFTVGFTIIGNIKDFAVKISGISRHLDNLKKDDKLPSDFFVSPEYSFLRYFKEASQFFMDSINVRRDQKKAEEFRNTFLLSTNADGIRSWPGYIAVKGRLSIIAQAKESETSNSGSTWRLHLLEGSIWHFTSIGNEINLAVIKDGASPF